MNKEKVLEMYKELCSYVASDCYGCIYHDYSTRAISYICDNEESTNYGFIDGSYGCDKHSKLIELEKKYKELL